MVYSFSPLSSYKFPFTAIVFSYLYRQLSVLFLGFVHFVPTQRSRTALSFFLLRLVSSACICILIDCFSSRYHTPKNSRNSIAKSSVLPSPASSGLPASLSLMHFVHRQSPKPHLQKNPYSLIYAPRSMRNSVTYSFNAKLRFFTFSVGSTYVTKSSSPGSIARLATSEMRGVSVGSRWRTDVLGEQEWFKCE